MASGRLSFVFVVAALVASVGLMPPSAVAELRTDYYASTCPKLEVIVRSSVKQSMAQSPISAPAALRLFFHDCAVRVRIYTTTFDGGRGRPVIQCLIRGYVRARQGCDASIMIVNSNGDDEWRNSDSQSLKPEGFQTILNAKAAVDSDAECRYKVSCADIMALAARESVYQVATMITCRRQSNHHFQLHACIDFSERRAVLPGGVGPVRRPGVHQGRRRAAARQLQPRPAQRLLLRPRLHPG
jgi:peroxidase